MSASRANSGGSLAAKVDSLQFQHFYISFPAEHIVQVTINRPEKLNSINKATSREIADVWDLFDQDEDLWVAIITGSGRAFCTGADLQEWNAMNKAGVVNDMSAPGLAGLPRRSGKKPIIAAVNGITMGGGFEMVANCDLIVAASSAVFALPEVKRGIVPVAGCLPRLTRTLGLQRTTELTLTGRSVSAQTLHDWGLVNEVVASADNVVEAATKLASEICQNSPDAVIVGREGIRLSWESGSVEEAVETLANQWYPRLMKGANFREGIEAFVEKRPVRWVNSKL
ncbi:Mevalonyl-coenzyme A hydratase sidH [Pseudocercospora fuligena]|uniref:Mevalonyl-coenzyme A hydratase sidH n=1 Tax=Pseudocercospora fuligena TaxID=685502 RepID=A0A8H6RKQ0_9PEZI|nr:Mevalonyl-coenzyme A hydratase sidH [Pseudocercospora fuligena]